MLGGYFGFGRAWLGDEVPDDTGSESGLGGNFRVGYGLSHSVFLGVETSTWSDLSDTSEGDVGLSFRSFGPSLAWYPGSKGLYLRGLVGWSWLDLELRPTGGPTYRATEDGFGAALAIGWEWRIGSTLAIGPQLDFGYLDVGEVPALSQTLGESFPFSATWANLTVFAVLYL